MARRPANSNFSFGWFRSEILGALVSGGFLLGMALVVIYMASMRLGAPIDLPTGPMLMAAAGGLLTEFISLGLIWKQSRSDLNTRGALWHILQTFVGSLLIFITALGIEFTGFLLIDPILGMVFGFVLIWASLGVLRDAARLLMEGTPKEIDLKEAVRALAILDRVKDVHHAHAWALTSERNVFSAHLCIREDIGSGAILQKSPCHAEIALRVLFCDIADRDYLSRRSRGQGD